MTEQPLVSIIIPTYNRADLIGETLDSILAQTYHNWECIVVDDGSTDNTSDVLANYTKKDDRISYHHRPNQYKAGGNGARNYGFDLSKGDYINWFDSDDVMLEDKIELQMNKLLNSGFNFCVCNSYVFEGNITNILNKRSKIMISEYVFYDYLIQEVMIMTPSTIFKKNNLEKLNVRFNESLKAAQEWEFYGRLLSRDTNFIVVDKCLIYIRQHANSISYNKEKELERSINYLKARKFVYKYIEKREDLTKEKNYLYNYIKIQTENYMRSKDYKSLNEAIFFEGVNFNTLISFFSIYFFIYTDKLKSKMRYV